MVGMDPVDAPTVTGSGSKSGNIFLGSGKAIAGFTKKINNTYE